MRVVIFWVIWLFLVITPHLAIGAAWESWKLCPLKFQPPRWRTVLLFLGPLACPLNIGVFWVYMAWVRFHQTDVCWWKGRDKFEEVSGFLVGFALLTAVFGKGRARPVLSIAR